MAGNRRFEACKLLRWKYVPAKIRDLSERGAFELQLIENIQRMTFNPIDEARAFKKYTMEFGWGGESDLARTISRSEQFVSNRIQLLRLPKAIIDEITQNRLKVLHALEIINLDEKEQVRRVPDPFGPEHVTILTFEEFIKDTQAAVNEVLNFLGLEPYVPSNIEEVYDPHLNPTTRTRMISRLSKIAFGPRRSENGSRSMRKNSL